MSLDKSGIYKTINEIERLCAQCADVNSFVPLVESLVTANPISLASINEHGIRLYRATNHHRGVPAKISDLTHPPAELTKMGRANRVGQPMFYCSSDPSCAYLEIGVNVGQVVVYATWITTAPIFFHDIGYIPKVLERAGSKRKLLSHQQSFSQFASNSDAQNAREFLALAFTEPTDTKYALTAAIAEVFLRGDELQGIKYPAITKAANVDNVAIRPEFVQYGMQLEAAQLVMVDEVASGQIGGVVICDLEKVTSDGSLLWKYRDQGEAMLSGAARTIASGDKVRFQGPGEIMIEGRKYKIEAGYLLEFTNDEITIRGLNGGIVNPLE